MPSCGLCGCALDAGTRVAELILDEQGVPALAESTFSDGRDGTIAYFCAEHVHAIDVIRSLIPTPAEIQAKVRGYLFQELDILAYALEMECAEALAAGREGDAERAQQTRLGVRLAQRLVGGVPAPEISDRLNRWRDAYLAKFPA